MKIHVITLFPEFFEQTLKTGLLGKAMQNNLLQVNIVQLRDFAINSYGKVDDAVYGGGKGMLLMIEPIDKAIQSLGDRTQLHVILMTPRGFLLNQNRVKQLYLNSAAGEKNSNNKELVIICGHYEGVDERVAQFLCDESICIGDYVLSGGEPAALVLIDAVSRLIPGYMNSHESLNEESFEQENYIEYPQYTRPETYENMTVPAVLLSGNHQEIEEYRKLQAREAYNKFRGLSKKSDR